VKASVSRMPCAPKEEKEEEEEEEEEADLQ
jgi:hypothetical protein